MRPVMFLSGLVRGVGLNICFVSFFFGVLILNQTSVVEISDV